MPLPFPDQFFSWEGTGLPSPIGADHLRYPFSDFPGSEKRTTMDTKVQRKEEL
jgi:hypothetical protein